MKKIVIPSVFAFVALSVLLGLGTWQVQRHNWKMGLLEDIRAGMNQKAVAYGGEAAGHKQFSRVFLKGRYVPNETVYVHSIRKGVLGRLVFTPIKYADQKMVFVNRGFVPYHLMGKELKARGDVDVEVSGFVRFAEKPAAFTPSADEGKRLFYLADLKGIQLMFRLPGLELNHFIEAQGGNGGAEWPAQRKPEVLLKGIPNKHFGYAITWFGLAGSLMLVFVAYIWSVRRKS